MSTQDTADGSREAPSDGMTASEATDGGSPPFVAHDGPVGLQATSDEDRRPARPEADADTTQEADGTTEDDVLEATLGAPSLDAALEAVLLVPDQPLDVASLASLVRRHADEVLGRLHALAADYTTGARGFDLREVAGGWRFYTRSDCAEIVERYVRDGQQARLTQAALETLAVVAYRQPVSRARISAVRGVNVDGVVRTLTTRGLVTEIRTDPVSGAVLFGTTGYFLERMGLGSLEEMPPLAPYLPDFDAFDGVDDAAGDNT